MNLQDTPERRLAFPRSVKAKRPALFRIALAAFLFALLRPLAAQEAALPSLANAKLGLFVHYVFGLTQAAPGKPPLKDLNRFADDLDVNGIADVASAMGAQYVILTSYHWRMSTLFPSQVWGSIFPKHATRRDVIGALARALQAKGIKLVLYVHPDDRHDFPLPMLHKLVNEGWTSATLLDASRHGEPHDPQWNRLYYRLLHEIGRRYGRLIAGYWEDDGGGGSDGATVQGIMQRYTTNASIWVNGGVTHAPATLQGGEKWNLFDHRSARHLYRTWSGQAAIVIVQGWWARRGKLAYTPVELYRFLVCTIGTKGQRNGGVAYATSPFSDNQWETGVRAGLTELGKLIRANAPAIYDTVPSRAYVSGEAPTQKPGWGVAVDAEDGRTVYLHVLMPPSGTSLQIGPPADRAQFTRATLLDGTSIAMQANAQGFLLTLPSGRRWSQVDTVIALRVKKAGSR